MAAPTGTRAASNTVQTTSLTLANVTYTFGSQASTLPWAVHSWVHGDFSSNTTTGFMVRLTWNQGSCAAARFARVDTLNVRVTYTATVTSAPADKALKGPGTPCLNGLADCKNPDGSILNYRGFWGTMNTEGAANINGDAFQPYYDVPTGTPRRLARPHRSGPATTTSTTTTTPSTWPPARRMGSCISSTPSSARPDSQSGTGDRWFGGNNGISSWYEIYNTNNTPYNLLRRHARSPRPAVSSRTSTDRTRRWAVRPARLECKQQSRRLR